MFLFTCCFPPTQLVYWFASNVGPSQDVYITVNRRRLVRLASDVTEYVIVHFLFWSCDQYRAWMLKSHITNNKYNHCIGRLEDCFFAVNLAFQTFNDLINSGKCNALFKRCFPRVFEKKKMHAFAV